MSLSKEEIERLHNSGKMPDFYYYQVNGKNIEENFAEIYRKRQEEMRELLFSEKLNAKIEEEIDEVVPRVIDKAIKEIF